MRRNDVRKRDSGPRDQRLGAFARHNKSNPVARPRIHLAGVDHVEAEFCIEALEEALAKHGTPDIFNTDQGSQFTSAEFTGVLIKNAIFISMDGKGSWRDNVFVERLWRSVKYEEVYLSEPNYDGSRCLRTPECRTAGGS
jgi:transposase InsO family protein